VQKRQIFGQNFCQIFGQIFGQNFCRRDFRRRLTWAHLGAGMGCFLTGALLTVVADDSTLLPS
jgi:hypothetical protein